MNILFTVYNMYKHLLYLAWQIPRKITNKRRFHPKLGMTFTNHNIIKIILYNWYNSKILIITYYFGTGWLYPLSIKLSESDRSELIWCFSVDGHIITIDTVNNQTFRCDEIKDFRTDDCVIWVKCNEGWEDVRC